MNALSNALYFFRKVRALNALYFCKERAEQLCQKACMPQINMICLQHFKHAHFPKFYLDYLN